MRKILTVPLALTLALTFAVLALSGCAAPGGGRPPSDRNDNINSNGGGGGPSGGNDNADDPDDNGSGGNDNGTAENDNGDDSGELPTAFRLDGVWDDNGRHAIIEQNGDQVTANYFSEYICDTDNGPVPVDEEPEPGANTESTFFNFSGVLSSGEEVLPGDLLTGETTICLFGFDGVRGLQVAEMTLQVIDENTISGEWEYDGDGDPSTILSGSIFLTREQ